MKIKSEPQNEPQNEPKSGPRRMGKSYTILFIAIFGGLDIIVVIEVPAPLNDVSNGSTFYIYGNGCMQGKFIEGGMDVNDNICNTVEYGRYR